MVGYIVAMDRSAISPTSVANETNEMKIKFHAYVDTTVLYNCT